MDNENNKLYATTDFYLAAFCLAKGIPLLEVDKSNPQQYHFVFDVFEDKAKQLAEDFLYAKSEIEPKRLVSAIKELKQLMYSQI
jgi:hypothetical protein